MNDTIKLYNSRILKHIDDSNVVEKYVVNRFNYLKQHSKKTYSKKAQIFKEIHSNIDSLNDELNEVTLLHFDDSLVKFYPITHDNIFIDNGVNTIEKSCSKITFDLQFLMAKIAFNNYIESLESPSSYIQLVKTILQKENNFTSWDDVFETDQDLFWILLDLFVHSCDNLKCAISLEDKKDLLEDNYIYSHNHILDKNSLLNIWQILKELNETISENDILTDLNIESIPEKLELYFYLYYDKYNNINLPGLVESSGLVEYYSDFHKKIIVQKHFRILFHKNTLKFMKEREHNLMENRVSILMKTFFWWMILNINPIDRYRYLLAGSCIKSAYNFRDANDVDFFVLDHNDVIEKYSKYFPNIGNEGYFEDFGKTYYANEEYYFPMIPSMFEKNKLFKQNQRKNDQKEVVAKTINNNFPKYSVSGLKVARYFKYYQSLLSNFEFSKKIETLDDFLVSNETKIYYLGCPLIDLRYEICRDHIKDIDLERVSLKQCHDFHYCLKKYPKIFTDNQIKKLGLEKYKSSFTNKWKIPLIKLEVNIYHKPYESEERAGYGILILHCPLYFNNILKLFIKKSPLTLFDQKLNNDISEYTYNNILLSSLPSKIKIKNEEIDGNYHYELNSDGIFDIGLIVQDNVFSINEKIVACGNIKINVNSNTKKISFSVKNIYSNKEYYLTVINLIKGCINFHKLIDCHTPEKIILEYIK